MGVKFSTHKMYQAYNWMNIDILDLKLTWSYLWSVILKYRSWALIDKVLQFVFEFDRSIDEIFNFLIFSIFSSCNTVIEIGLISVFNYISEVDTEKPTKLKARIWNNSKIWNNLFRIWLPKLFFFQIRGQNFGQLELETIYSLSNRLFVRFNVLESLENKANYSW